jgi:hypothetical protein
LCVERNAIPKALPHPKMAHASLTPTNSLPLAANADSRGNPDTAKRDTVMHTTKKARTDEYRIFLSHRAASTVQELTLCQIWNAERNKNGSEEECANRKIGIKHKHDFRGKFCVFVI